MILSTRTIRRSAGQGRDGETARAVLFYRPENMNIQKFLKGGGLLEEDKVQHVAELIHNEQGPVDIDSLREQTGLSERKLVKAISRLEEQGAVETLPSGEVVPAEDSPNLSEAAKAAAEEQRKRKEHEVLRLEKMQVYAEMSGCRREYVLSYFGDHSISENCGNCDNCLGREDKPRRPFEPGSRVEHVKLGRGVVERYQDGNIVVLFDDGGRTTLSMKFVKENNLLKPAA